MSTERWFWIKKIEVESENDGETFLRRGPETRREEMSLHEAVETFGKAKMAAVLRRAAEDIEQDAPASGLGWPAPPKKATT